MCRKSFTMTNYLVQHFTSIRSINTALDPLFRVVINLFIFWPYYPSRLISSHSQSPLFSKIQFPLIFSKVVVSLIWFLASNNIMTTWHSTPWTVAKVLSKYMELLINLLHILLSLNINQIMQFEDIVWIQIAVCTLWLSVCTIIFP